MRPVETLVAVLQKKQFISYLSYYSYLVQILHGPQTADDFNVNVCIVL